MTLAICSVEVDGKLATADGVEVCEALNRLADAGADVVGLNCVRGPATMLPILEDAVKYCQVRNNSKFRFSYPPNLRLTESANATLLGIKSRQVTKVHQRCLHCRTENYTFEDGM